VIFCSLSLINLAIICNIFIDSVINTDIAMIMEIVSANKF